jgi:hypothetical protein
VQVNVGVGLGHVAALRKQEALANPPRTAEAIAHERAPEIARLLGTQLPDVSPLDLEGLAILLGGAVMGARRYPVKGLLKNMWGTMQKSELHAWWKLHLEALGQNISGPYLDKVPALVDAFVTVLEVPRHDRLLLKCAERDLVEIEQLKDLATLTVGQYMTEVLSFKADKLTKGMLAHRKETAGETSVIPASSVVTDTA